MKKLTNDEFIEKAKLVHGNLYSYDKFNYIKSSHKSIITCKIHGDFEQSPNNHLSGKGCKECSKKWLSVTKSKGLDAFIEKSISVHGYKYEYSKVKYMNWKTPVTIICPFHGEFQQEPQSHQRGNGCSLCGRESTSKKLTLKTSDFINRASKIHKNYDYSKVVYKSSTDKVIIICRKHGEFTQTPNSHLNCSGCNICKLSKGEKIIKSFLDSKNINYKCQYRFDDCKDKYTLPFDFYLLDYNTCIEFDGYQHFNPVEKWGGIENLNDIIKKDKIKSEYCINNKIELLRITFEDDILLKLNSYFNITR